MNLLSKIQNLPERDRKVILWLIMIILGSFLLWLNIQNVQKTLKAIDVEKMKEEFQISSLKEEFKKMPKFEIPEKNEKK